MRIDLWCMLVLSYAYGDVLLVLGIWVMMDISWLALKGAWRLVSVLVVACEDLWVADACLDLWVLLRQVQLVASTLQLLCTCPALECTWPFG